MEGRMTRAERIRAFPKAGWRNQLTRHLIAISKHPAPTPFLDYQTKTALHLPFSGEWYVYWGGRTVAQNKHVVVSDQRFAYDFLILPNGGMGQSYRGSGANNNDYYCYGQPIYAPADGVVLQMEDGLADNAPGEMNPKKALGNYVILDHGCAEFSFFAHFQPGSLAVRNGDRVQAGRLLARCGNSGNSSEPHLHYHLQNSPEPFRGKGLPAFFVDYFANEKPVTRGEPKARQIVRSQLEFSGK
jgi:murein DD-endopeptidase MepM/ murein hydrolase activator NlpD